MKIFLDDERATPEGWVRVYSSARARMLAGIGAIERLSFENISRQVADPGGLKMGWL